MPIPLEQKSKCCAEEVPQDALPYNKHRLQPPVDFFPEEPRTYTDPAQMERSDAGSLESSQLALKSGTILKIRNGSRLLQ